MWKVTRDRWHVTSDTWHIVWGEHSLKRGRLETLFIIQRAKLLQPISPHPMDQQGSPCCFNFFAVISSYHSKVNLVAAFDAEKLAATVLFNVLLLGFPTSLLQFFSSISLGVMMFWRSAGEGPLIQLINQSVNDKSVCITVPATPGLVIIKEKKCLQPQGDKTELLDIQGEGNVKVKTTFS